MARPMRPTVAVVAGMALALLAAGSFFWFRRLAAAFDEGYLERLTSLNEKTQRGALTEGQSLSETRMRRYQQLASEMLESPEINRRLRGTCALGMLGSRPYPYRVQLEHHLLNDPESAVRFAIAILPSLPMNAFGLRRSTSVLCDALQDRSRLVRWAAARTLGDSAMGEAFPLALWRLDPHDPDRAGLLELMTQSSLTPADVNYWMPLLHSPISSDRRIALHALAVIDVGSACGDMVNCLRDADPAVRATACIAVAKMHCLQAAPILFQLAQDPNVCIRGNALRALGMLQAEGAVALCTQTLQRPPQPAPAPVRHRAPPDVAFYDARGRAIRLPWNASSSLFKPTVLLDWEGAEERDERFCALVGLVLSQDSAAEPMLLAAARDADPRVRDAASLGLTSFGNPETLARLVSDSNRPLRARLAAARWLGDNHLQEHVPAFAAAASELLDSPDENAEAIEFLGQLLRELGRAQQPELLPMLRRGVRHPSPEVRKSALRALGNYRTEEACALVQDVEKHDYDRNVGATATDQLSRMNVSRRKRHLLAPSR